MNAVAFIPSDLNGILGLEFAGSFEPMKARQLRKARARHRLRQAIFIFLSATSLTIALWMLFRYPLFRRSPKLQIDIGSQCCDKLNCPDEIGTCDSVNNQPLSRGECGIAPGNMARIAGGTSVNFNSWPWYVDVIHVHQGPQSRHKHCGGTVINNWYILTAAHCIHQCIQGDSKTPSSSVVVSFPARSNQFRTVCKVILKDGYDSGSLANDIALLRLSRPISEDGLTPYICLPKRQTSHVGDSAIVIGRASNGGSQGRKLSQLNTTIIPPIYCLSRYGHFFDHRRQICAKSPGSQTPCQGDSGGPLMRMVQDRWEIVGIVSYGHGCGSSSSPDVYTDVTAFTSWIEEKIRRTFT